MNSKTAELEPHTDFLWTREDYEELVRLGVFGSEDHVELLDGRIVTMAPQYAPHATAVTLITRWLDRQVHGDHFVRCQLPIGLDRRSEPEPDLAVVRGGPRDFAKRHPGPEATVLIVEVADSSLEFDRGPKLRAYARAGIPEYWIVDLGERTIEICREPDGEDYRDRRVFSERENVSPNGFSAAEVEVSELLP